MSAKYSIEQRFCETYVCTSKANQDIAEATSLEKKAVKNNMR